MSHGYVAHSQVADLRVTCVCVTPHNQEQPSLKGRELTGTSGVSAGCYGESQQRCQD